MGAFPNLDKKEAQWIGRIDFEVTVAAIADLPPSHVTMEDLKLKEAAIPHLYMLLEQRLSSYIVAKHR
jgi:hypothetical protein